MLSSIARISSSLCSSRRPWQTSSTYVSPRVPVGLPHSDEVQHVPGRKVREAARDERQVALGAHRLSDAVKQGRGLSSDTQSSAFSRVPLPVARQTFSQLSGTASPAAGVFVHDDILCCEKDCLSISKLWVAVDSFLRAESCVQKRS